MVGSARWRNARRNRQRGAATVEYLAVLLILASSLSVGLVTGLAKGALVDQVNFALCKSMVKAVRVLGVEVENTCVAPMPKNMPPCVTYKQDRLLGANGTFRFIRGELTGKDTIVDLVDPVTGDESALVFLSNEAGVGLEYNDSVSKGKFTSAMESRGLSPQGKLMLQGGTGVVYEFDSHEDAQNFLDSRRGNLFTRGLGVITGGKADALFDGARNLFNDITGNDDDDAPTPSGLTADLAIQAEAGLSYETGTQSQTNGASFRLDATANGEARGQFRYNFDGTSQIEVRFEGEVGLEGGVGANEHLKDQIPLLGDLSVTGGGNLAGAVGYRLRFDKHGNPTQFVLTTESGGGLQWKAGANRGHAGGQDGELTVNTYTLDLTNPENMDAFADSFPALAAGQLASPISPVAILTTDNPISRRLKENSVQYEQVYDTEGDMLGVDSPDSANEKGLKIKGVGIGFNDETAKRTLRTARYIDHSQPGSTWQNLAKCEG
ncbi:MAG: hypothetical protein GEV10_15155 [Streptosporangiales bacterium]|nr:hypothetical protein [Streptosporangiales bacterium]